jgi:hypothetical protein
MAVDARRSTAGACRCAGTADHQSVPISTRDAQTILDALRGGDVTLHVRVANDEAIRPIWTVIGRVNGAHIPMNG